MLNILIVDDDIRDREGICSTIKKIDPSLNTFTASCGQEAIEILENNNISILLTDIKMPDMLGTELAQRAKEIQHDIIIILISAHREFEYAQDAIRFGVMRYLLKPYLLSDLISTLEEAIRLCAEKVDFEKQLPENNQEKAQKVLKFLKGQIVLEQSELAFYFDVFKLQILLVKFLNPVIGAEEQREILDKNFRDKLYFFPLEHSKYIILTAEENAYESDRLTAISYDIKNNFDQEVCIAFSPVSPLEHLPSEFSNIEQLSEYFFFSNKSVVLSSSEIISDDFNDGLSVDFLLDKINILIDIEDYISFLDTLNMLFETLKKKQHFSSLYAKCISANILNRLFKNHTLGDSQREKIAELFASNSADGIIAFFESIVSEIDIGDNRKNSPRIIAKVLNIIDNEYMTELSLEYIAEIVFITPSYLSRLFKKEMGKTFVEYLKEYRMKKAREFLSNTNMLVSEIGKAVGYSSSSYFTTLFHQIYHLTPAQYREREKKN